jgi:GT2 family glycosyltransferase
MYDARIEVQISLIVCTKNRARQLMASLDAMRRIRCDLRWELIVVDNGSTDDTSSVLARFNSDFHEMRSTYEPKSGLGRARDKGCKCARGELFVFTDDDCYPSEDFLDATCEVFKENPDWGYVGGRVLLHDPRDIRMTISESMIPVFLPPRSFIPAGLIKGANMAMRRNAYASVEGFDPRFGAGALFSSGDDLEIMSRISAVGWPGAYDPRPVVYHHHGRRSQEEADELMKRYDRGRGANYAKSILNPILRKTYLKHWYWSARKKSIVHTFREMSAGIEFLIRDFLRPVAVTARTRSKLLYKAGSAPNTESRFKKTV